MLVLLVILVPTTKVNAAAYTSKDDVIIDTKYYEFFKAQFGEDTSYKFFAYDCFYGTYTRTCYYGINKDNNYVNVDYTSSGTNSYSMIIKKGTDNNFSVTGTNVIEVSPSADYQLLYALTFFIVLFVSNIMTSIIFSKNRR